MPTAATTIYDVEHVVMGVRVWRLRVNNDVYTRALNGEYGYENKVAMQFRKRFIKDNHWDPGFIAFDLLDFKLVAEVDAVP